MRRRPRAASYWGSTAPAANRSGVDPINPLRIKRFRDRGLSFREIGILIAKEDGRQMPYTDAGVARAFYKYRDGERDEDGERSDFIPATYRKPRAISLGSGIGMILFPRPR